MENYFKENPRLELKSLDIKNDLPINPRDGEWHIKQEPERFFKVFSFSDRRRLADFINEIINFEDAKNHHGSVSFDHLDVIVEIYTKDLDRVTNQDKEYCRAIDDIFQDCLYYEY